MHRDLIDEQLREIDQPKSIVLEHAPIENANRLFLKTRSHTPRLPSQSLNAPQ